MGKGHIPTHIVVHKMWLQVRLSTNNYSHYGYQLLFVSSRYLSQMPPKKRERFARLLCDWDCLRDIHWQCHGVRVGLRGKDVETRPENMMKLDDIGSKMNQYIKMYWICKYLCTNCFKPQSPTNWWHLHSCHKKIAVKVASNVGDTVQTVHVIVEKRIYCELQVWFQRDIEEKWQAKCRVESSDANPARQFGFPNRCWLSLVDAVNSWWGRSQQNMGWNGSFMFCQGILRNAGWWYCWWCLVG